MQSPSPSDQVARRGGIPRMRKHKCYNKVAAVDETRRYAAAAVRLLQHALAEGVQLTKGK